MQLEKVMFLISLTRDEDSEGRLVDFECVDGQYVVIVSKNNDEINQTDYIRYILKQDGDYVFISKEYNDVLVNNFTLAFKEIVGNYLAKLDSNNDEVVLYSFDVDVLKTDKVDRSNIKNFDIARKKRR